MLTFAELMRKSFLTKAWYGSHILEEKLPRYSFTVANLDRELYIYNGAESLTLAEVLLNELYISTIHAE